MSSNKCPLCPELNTFPNVQSFRDHLEEHPNYKHFVCDLQKSQQLCGQRFKYKKDLVKHQKNSLHDQSNEYITPAFHIIRTHTKTAESWDHWVSLYKQQSSSSDSNISPEQRQATTRLIHKLTELELWNESLINDEWKFEDMIDQIEDYLLQQPNQLKTIGNQLRLLFWYCLYLFSIHSDMSEESITFIHKRSAHYHVRATNSQEYSLGIQIMDPYQMVILRYELLTALKHQQKTFINPFIQKFISERPTQFDHELKEFGAKHLRCFIDLIIRFTNVPMRIQATKHLHLSHPFCQTSPDQPHVARLLFENFEFTRIFLFDKVGKTGAHRPIRCPIPSLVTPYLFFYIQYCRPNTTSDRTETFINPNGGVWINASTDLKHYIKHTLGNNVLFIVSLTYNRYRYLSN
jgi:hypothetical protein